MINRLFIIDNSTQLDGWTNVYYNRSLLSPIAQIRRTASADHTRVRVQNAAEAFQMVQAGEHMISYSRIAPAALAVYIGLGPMPHSIGTLYDMMHSINIATLRGAQPTRTTSVRQPATVHQSSRSACGHHHSPYTRRHSTAAYGSARQRTRVLDLQRETRF